MISPDEIIVGCYELAHFYHVDPRVFLEQTIGEITRHKMWTVKLTERIRAAQEAETPIER